jgi:hypothetical protein
MCRLEKAFGAQLRISRELSRSPQGSGGGSQSVPLPGLIRRSNQRSGDLIVGPDCGCR